MVTGRSIRDATASAHAERDWTVIVAFAGCLLFWGLVGCLIAGVF